MVRTVPVPFHALRDLLCISLQYRYNGVHLGSINNRPLLQHGGIEIAIVHRKMADTVTHCIKSCIAKNTHIQIYGRDVVQRSYLIFNYS